MKFTAATITTFALLCSASAEEEYPINTANLTFYQSSGQLAYHLSVYADGGANPTHDWNTKVGYLDAPDYLASSFCHYEYNLPAGAPEPKTRDTIAPDGRTGRVVFDPPTGIRDVRCKGFCVGQQGVCNGNGVIPKVCCNGYCAADLCRPWDGHI